MLPVEVVPLPGGTLVLRARGSELLILPQHTAALKQHKTPKDFAGYFLQKALLNRPARKLFEAWLRKDKDLWKRIYVSIQNEVEVDEKLATEASIKEQEMEKPEPYQSTAPKPSEHISETDVMKPHKAQVETTIKKPTTTEKQPNEPKKSVKAEKPAKKASSESKAGGKTKKTAKPAKKTESKTKSSSESKKSSTSGAAKKTKAKR